MIIKRIIEALRRLFTRQAVYYIGGSEILPPPLSAEEEAAAVTACQAGDEHARSMLIEHNLRLVVFLARKFESSGVGTDRTAAKASQLTAFVRVEMAQRSDRRYPPA